MKQCKDTMTIFQQHNTSMYGVLYRLLTWGLCFHPGLEECLKSRPRSTPGAPFHLCDPVPLTCTPPGQHKEEMINVHAKLQTFILSALQYNTRTLSHPFQSISHVSLTLPLQICNPLSEKGIILQQQHSAQNQNTVQAAAKFLLPLVTGESIYFIKTKPSLYV